MHFTTKFAVSDEGEKKTNGTFSQIFLTATKVEDAGLLLKSFKDLLLTLVKVKYSQWM